jgi:hypothetical protein
VGVGDNTVGASGDGCTVWCTFSKAREALAYVRRRGGMWYEATEVRSVDALSTPCHDVILISTSRASREYC